MVAEDSRPRPDRLLPVIRALSFCRTLQEVMAIVRREARTLSGADGVTFVLRDGEHCHYAEENAIGPLWKGRRFPITSCISGWVMLNRRSVAIEDIYLDPRVPADAYRPTFVKSLAMVPVRAEDPLGAIGAYWATNHRAMAEEIDVLESLAEACALAIENARLYGNLQQALERAEALNRAKDEWISVLSHELRTPLTPILGWTTMLRSVPLDSARRDYALQVIERNVKDEIRIVDDLLDVSRMMVGRMRIEPRPLDLRAPIQSAVENLRAEADRKGVSLSATLPDGEIEVDGDADRLQRAVGNLVGNSIKFTPAGGRVEISAPLTDGQVSVVVRDNGEGMPSDVVARIFERFERADSSMARTDGGLGLGLFIVRQIAEQHGGSVSAHSDGPGRGSMFVLHLPLKQAGQRRTGAPAAVEHQA